MSLILVVMAALGACGDGGGVKQEAIARIEVSEGGHPVLLDGTLIISDATQAHVKIQNTGNADLLIKAIEVETAAEGAYTIISLPMPTPAAPVVVAPGGAPHEFSIDFDGARVAAGVRPRATIRIRTNTTLAGTGEFVFYATPETVIAKLVVQPGVIDFETVEAGTTSTKSLNLLNTGAAPLTISAIALTGDAGFTAAVAGATFTSSGATAALAEPLTLAPSSARQVDVTFASHGQGAARAELTFTSNDPGAPAGTRVSLLANLAGPCLRPIPTRLDFGAKRVGQTSELPLELESCGDREVVVSAIELADDGGGLFAVDRVALPLTIAAGTRATVPVRYVPDAVAALGADGQYVSDRGLLRIRSNAYLEALDVPLSGFGSGSVCPIAAIEIAEGSEVVPQTLLHLTSRSSSPNGAITSWQWSVLQPDHSVSQFFPSAVVEAPQFTPNIVGTYIFRLEVSDAQGVKSCVPAEAVVEVASDDAIHVELVWRTPGDVDETDEGGSATFSWGSDVDLHFLHPRAEGKFFAEQYDCYWNTPVLDWGPPGEVGDPRLDRDDRDGGGPENLNMKTPEEGVRYQVGVHYFNDWGYGGAFATVRIYIYGVLREQWAEVPITNAALWESHTIEWPSGKVTRVTGPDGAPKITPGYPMP